MSIYQTNINTIVAALYQKGLRHAVICPGSRNAPLIMAFARFGKIKCSSVADERSAAFIALGMSKKLQIPVAIVCTSGSAVLNLYPAIGEAYYMQVPLLVITADRPEEMLDRWDGQTIRQFRVFEPHILGSFRTPENIDVEQINEIIEISSNFYDKGNAIVKGPTHLNVPLKEPLYAASGEIFIYPEISFEEKIIVEDEFRLPFETEHFFADHTKVMVLHGADEPHENNEQIKILGENNFPLVLSDVISNKHAFGNIKNWEGVFLNANKEQLKELVPDLLITTGKMVLNKTIKNLFRNYKPGRHWHIEENGFYADTFFTNPEIIKLKPEVFFGKLTQILPQHASPYFDHCMALSDKQALLSDSIISQNYNEFFAVKTVLSFLKDHLVLHLANSMSVRYAAYLNFYLKDNWQLFSNRGVSGIDGCTSTAIGSAMVDPRLHVLITGDIAFFYDINALWQKNLPDNFKIVLLNDFGGGIFRNIDGPAQLPELNPYLETPHQMNASLIAEHFKLDYWVARHHDELMKNLTQWLASNKAAILEIQTDAKINSLIFNQYKQQQI